VEIVKNRREKHAFSTDMRLPQDVYCARFTVLPSLVGVLQSIFLRYYMPKKRVIVKNIRRRR